MCIQARRRVSVAPTVTVTKFNCDNGESSLHLFIRTCQCWYSFLVFFYHIIYSQRTSKDHPEVQILPSSSHLLSQYVRTDLSVGVRATVRLPENQPRVFNVCVLFVLFAATPLIVKNRRFTRCCVRPLNPEDVAFGISSPQRRSLQAAQYRAI